MITQISQDTVIVATNNQVSGELPDGEVAILETKAGMYYGLNPVGARVWQLIQEPIQIKAICELLTQEYEVEYTTCMAEVVALLDDMLAQQLIEIRTNV